MWKFIKGLSFMCAVQLIELQVSCIRASKRMHRAYQRARTPLHGLYFCAAAVESHGVLVYVPLALLAMLVIGWLIEERFI